MTFRHVGRALLLNTLVLALGFAVLGLSSLRPNHALGLLLPDGGPRELARVGSPPPARDPDASSALPGAPPEAPPGVARALQSSTWSSSRPRTKNAPRTMRWSRKSANPSKIARSSIRRTTQWPTPWQKRCGRTSMIYRSLVEASTQMCSTCAPHSASETRWSIVIHLPIERQIRIGSVAM